MSCQDVMSRQDVMSHHVTSFVLNVCNQDIITPTFTKLFYYLTNLTYMHEMT